MPSFVARVERPDRGGEWIAYLDARERAAERWVARLGLDRRRDADAAAPVGAAAARRRRRGRAAGRAAVRGVVGPARRRRASAWPRCSAAERGALLADLVGARSNRRHRPGRGFEALRYRFEIVADYGAFRDLQRHRMLTVQWQRLTPHLGAGVPEEVDAAGCGDDYRRALDVSAQAWERLAGAGREREATYALCLGLPHPLRARPQRPRGDAADRAALRARGPPGLPRGRARDAPADRRGAPRGRRGHDARRRDHGAARWSGSSARCARRRGSRR